MAKNVKILGTGCMNCQTTLKMVKDVAAENDVDIEIEKVEDIQKILSFGVMSTPAVVVDGKVVHAGSIPTREVVKGWLLLAS